MDLVRARREVLTSYYLYTDMIRCYTTLVIKFAPTKMTHSSSLPQSNLMLLLWISLGLAIFLSCTYILLIILLEGSARHIDSRCFLTTYVLCLGVSVMMVVAIHGAMNIIHDADDPPQ